MDQHNAIARHQRLLELLQEIMDEDIIAYLHFDCMGMERAQGKIEGIFPNAQPPYLLLNTNDIKVNLDEIIGVNGVNFL